MSELLIVKNELMKLNKVQLVRLLMSYYFLDMSKISAMLDHLKLAHSNVSKAILENNNVPDVDGLIEDLHK